MFSTLKVIFNPWELCYQQYKNILNEIIWLKLFTAARQSNSSINDAYQQAYS